MRAVMIFTWLVFWLWLKLKEIEGTLTGRVKFIFQPAEELGHGAFKIIETDALRCTSSIGFS